ncbi:MAG TPA: Co2+/Mg2+ efflux protein ApaG [Candidatus Lambdaproteobacteria bacterium]|jgi:ApaG protein|nr:Co2+/Mg2+ efflux protein ApaG [SAR324 cluster bacterium]HBL56938.1 Co2+/Mg2+ efflux protein ApaG [Deltaproteobacteria bacterium]HHZ78424.1 Co2+/Mg2+ efflux protein ApaG [Candidatus Lambdaproteobacteria bacterium]HIA57436.1 Co2+/Mg2+ efflux protein ApaG [Candidatus Lambdaproteobacteria bacterium]HIB45595.1 Co2+/Mg2+ efflux protein ApaG [Candidatus Lambdaproteobacteria bacterium]
MEEAITEGVQVQAEAFYLEMHSLPEEERYVFAYRIRLKNLSQRTVQLLRRHWIITDSNGEINEVHGEGVVGDQPVLAPDEEYEYTSGSQLKSPVGTMQGSYQMTTTEGVEFEVTIPCFTLAVPGVIN